MSENLRISGKRGKFLKPVTELKTTRDLEK